MNRCTLGFAGGLIAVALAPAATSPSQLELTYAVDKREVISVLTELRLRLAEDNTLPVSLTGIDRFAVVPDRNWKRNNLEGQFKLRLGLMSRTSLGLNNRELKRALARVVDEGRVRVRLDAHLVQTGRDSLVRVCECQAESQARVIEGELGGSSGELAARKPEPVHMPVTLELTPRRLWEYSKRPGEGTVYELELVGQFTFAGSLEQRIQLLRKARGHVRAEVHGEALAPGLSQVVCWILTLFEEPPRLLQLAATREEPQAGVTDLLGAQEVVRQALSDRRVWAAGLRLKGGNFSKARRMLHPALVPESPEVVALRASIAAKERELASILSASRALRDTGDVAVARRLIESYYCDGERSWDESVGMMLEYARTLRALGEEPLLQRSLLREALYCQPSLVESPEFQQLQE